MKPLRWLSLSVLFLVLAGCAHNQVSFRLDIYRDDPNLNSRLNPQDVARIEEKLDNITNQAQTIFMERTNFAGQMLGAYESGKTFQAALSSNQPSSFEGVEEMLTNHNYLLKQRLDRFVQSSDDARDLLQTYLAKYDALNGPPM